MILKKKFLKSLENSRNFQRRIKNSVITIVFLISLVLSATAVMAVPSITNTSTTGNSYDYIPTNTNFWATASVIDNSSILKNVTCDYNNQIYQASFFLPNHYMCLLTSPITQGNYFVNMTAENILNQTDSALINFTTIPSTTGSLSFNPNGQFVMNMTYSSPETRLINATLTNTGQTPMYTVSINITRFEFNFATTTAMSQSCGTIPAGQSCTRTFDINIPANTPSRVYRVFFNADWTNPDAQTPDNVFEISTWIRVVYNPEAVITPEINITATPTQTTSTNTNVQSIGNVPLSAVNISYAGGSLPASWLTISPNYFAQLNAGNSQNYEINITPPAGAAVGLYTGNINVTSNDQPKTQKLNVNVGPYYGWQTSIDQTLTYNHLLTSGTLTALTINNTGNVGQSFQVSYSGSMYSNGYLTNPTPSTISINPGQTYTMNINYNNFISVDGTYNLNIQIQNLNSSTNQNHQAQLIAENTAPSLAIISPTNNSAISGMTNIDVTATDALSGMQRVEFYVDSLLRGTDNDTADSTFSYIWNTSLAADKLITIEARAYDTVGNMNTITWYAYNQNPANSLPYINSTIPDLVIQEDNTSTTFPMDIVFLDNDFGETLTYTFAGDENITITVAAGTAYVVPDPDFQGNNLVTATATDSQGANVSDIFNVHVINVQDVPTIPFINAPLNGSVINSATGNVNFQWTASYDPDPEPLSYRLFIGTGTPQLYQVTTNTQLTATLSPGTYNWYILVYDGITTVQTATYTFQLVQNHFPQINSYIPTFPTVTVIKNNTLNFTVSVTELDNETLTHDWVLGTNQVSTNDYYLFDSTNYAVGDYQLVYTTSDPNQNSAVLQWTIQVRDQNQAPVLTQNFSYITIQENQIATINLNNYFSDPNIGDTLTFSASSTRDISYSFNNGIVTITPDNDFFGARVVTFSASDSINTTDSNPLLILVQKDNNDPDSTDEEPQDNDVRTSANQNVDFSVRISDPEDDPVSVYWYVDNVLKKSEVKSRYNLKEYPLQFISNGYFNGQIVVGEEGTIKETQAANLILNNLEDLTLEINDIYNEEETGNNNLIVIGTLDNNYLVKDLLSQANFDYEFSPGEALIKSVNYNNHVAIIITGYSDDDILEAAAYLDFEDNLILGTDHFTIDTSQNSGSYVFIRTSGFDYSFDQGQYEVEVKIVDGDGAEEIIQWDVETMSRPVADTFDSDTTDFDSLTEEELQEVYLVLEKSNYGKIVFDNPLNLNRFIDFDRYADIGLGYVAIDTNAIPELAGQPATVTLYNIVLNEPVIFYTGSFTTNPDNANSICNNCQIISYTNNQLTFHIDSFSSYFIKETQAASISLPEEIQLGHDNELRNQNLTTQFTITNPGNENDIENILIKSTASSKYMVQFSTDGITYSSEITIDLAAGDQDTIYLKGYIPKKEPGGRHSIGKITASNGEYSASSTLYLYPQNNIEVVSVKIDGDSVSDGDEAKIKPDEDLDVEIEVENIGSIDFDEVTIIGTIYDLDGDDVEEEVEFRLGDGRKKKETLVFDIPEDLDEDDYKLEIEIEAEDDDGIIHSQELEFTLITTKEKHKLKLDASLSTEVLQCVRQGTIRTEIKNLGSNDEDDVRLEIKESNLGIDFTKDNIEIDEDDEFRTSFALNLNDADAGNYKFTVTVYRDNKISEEQTLDLEIKECGQTKKIGQTKSTKAIEQEHQKLITAALAAQQQQPVTKVAEKSAINEWALVLLIITGILTLGIIIFVIGAVIIKKR
ncbi:MAG: hypothetical protein KAT77_03365 [Nanoarchaeota archaeon]|nr:hypothetical protein [Nanoarchaeota archaeon]